MKESSNKRGVIVGLFVFLGLVFLLAGILTVGNLHSTFTRKIKVVTLFDDVSGLQVGNNVWFSGVKVGTVNKVEFYGKSIKVTMKLNEKTQEFIRRDAKVKLSTDGLIGNRILVIYGGTSKAPEVQEGDTLAVEHILTTEDMMNTFQDNNKNFLEITNDIKTISKKLAGGEGSIGKLLHDETMYNNIVATSAALQNATQRAEMLVSSLATFGARLNKKGTLANELVTDTIVFKSMRAAVLELEEVSGTASVFIAELKKAGNNPKTPFGILMHDEQAGASLKATIKNLETSSLKLDKNLEAMQSSFLLRKGIKKQAKEKPATPK